MQSKDVFPARVREVIDLIEQGDVLSGTYKESVPMVDIATQTPKYYIEMSTPANLFNDLQEALQFYQDEDIEPPYYHLPDITAEALGDIPAATSDEQRALNRALIEYEEEHNFYELIKERIAPLAAKLHIEDEEASLVADIISSDLYHCAKARLLLEEPHPYFEHMLSIYRNQGMPIGWIGSEAPDEGEFIIYTRTYNVE